MGRYLDMAQEVIAGRAADRGAQLRRLQADYDRLLARERKAEACLQDESIPRAQRDRHLPAFEAVLDEIGRLTLEITAALGREMTREELLLGFGTEA